jgi:hypothetical protein
MTNFNWKDLLTEWNQQLLEDEDILKNLPPEVIASGWLGYPGATEEQLAQLEKRLGATLPPSYREFLRFTNGWRDTGYFIPAIWSTEEVEWFSVRNQDTIDAWREGTGDLSPRPDEEYFDYGEHGAGDDFRLEHLQAALEISDRERIGTAVYLLNPLVVTPEGEWEAWFFAHWIAGANRFRSFWDLMQCEHKMFLELRENKTKQKPSLLDQIQATLNDEDLETRKFGEWLLAVYQFFSGGEHNASSK